MMRILSVWLKSLLLTGGAAALLEFADGSAGYAHYASQGAFFHFPWFWETALSVVTWLPLPIALYLSATLAFTPIPSGRRILRHEAYERTGDLLLWLMVVSVLLLAAPLWHTSAPC